jgi:hypothetical protein
MAQKRPEPVITQDELAAAVEEARQDFTEVGDARPAGAMSIEEWAEKLGTSQTTMRVKMKRAVAAGLYEKLPIRVVDSRGQRCSISVYRKVKQASNAKVDRI